MECEFPYTCSRDDAVVNCSTPFDQRFYLEGHYETLI